MSVMCDHHHLRSSQGPVGAIEHTSQLSQHIGALFENAEYSDVTLLVEGKQFQAHKVILAARSEYFRALFFGGLLETNKGEIELKETKAVPFRYLLKYIYTGLVSLTDMKEDVLLEVLGLVHQYGFVELQLAISDYLKAVLSVRNVCYIYDLANMYSLKSLTNTCLEFMDCHAQEVLSSDAFLSLSEAALTEVVSRDSFCAKEIDIFKAVCKWQEQNEQRQCMDTVIQAIRFPLMSTNELLNTVRPSGLVPADTILDAFKVQNESTTTDLNYRGFLSPDENIATTCHGAMVTKGELKSALLDGDTSNYDLDRGFTRHPIEDGSTGIVVSLAQPSIINQISMLLWDRDMRSYSYTLEVSMDDQEWIKVVDYSKYMCRSWQVLYFTSRVVKYIRVNGVHNSVNRVFHLVSLECYYCSNPLRVIGGLVVPSTNIATIENSACVIEGVSRSRNALINGDTHNYDWDSGYTCHQLGSGSIVVQLAQPYLIGSMRLLLWDCDDRAYSYKIEVSTDQQQWHLVEDKTKDDCQSWQLMKFPERPVTFIRIVGTNNTANEVFHCVHFECPVDPQVQLRPGSRHTSTDGEEASAEAPAAVAAVQHPHNPQQFPQHFDLENNNEMNWPRENGL